MMDVHGFAGPGFAAVEAEFERNFSERAELGAAFSAYADGELVVDLWGGLADPDVSDPWHRDTTQIIFSGSKGLVAVCMAILIDRGKLDLDAPVCRYWPEFAAQGKGGVLVRHVMSHRAGLPAIRPEVQPDEILDDVHMAALLAAEPLFWPAGEALCYHVLTYGWLCGEIVRRVEGRSIGRFFDDEVARPLGLDLWIGLPSAATLRVAKLRLAATWGVATPLFNGGVPKESVLHQIYFNPPVLADRDFPWNDPRWHEAEIPAINAIGSTRSIARLYACLASGGELEGIRILTPGAVELGRRELSRGSEVLLDIPVAYGLGFELQTHVSRLGPPSDAFGASGVGGSLHGAWPCERVGFSYAMNEMRDSKEADPRGRALLDALHRAIRERASTSSALR